MRKKRKAVPHHLNKDKRKCLSWSMEELAAESTSDLIDDKIKYVDDDNAATQPSSSTQSQSSNIVTQQSQVYKEFLSKIQQSSVYLKVAFSLSEDQWSCVIGEFVAKLKFGNDSLNKKYGLHMIPECSVAWLYVTTDTDASATHILYFEIDNGTKKQDSTTLSDTCYYYVTTEFPSEYLFEMRTKMLQLVCSRYDEKRSELCIKILFLESGLLKLDFPSEPCDARNNSKYKVICKLLHHFYNKPLPGMYFYNAINLFKLL